MKRYFTVLLVCGFIAAGWVFWAIYIGGDNKIIENDEDRNNYVRLHILANSDSVEDQMVKLKVRDAIVSYLTPLVKTERGAQEAKAIINEHRAEILDLAKKVISAQGKDYPVNLQIGKFDFPLREYRNLVLPAGEYQAVRIIIGEGEGRNWWCVLFPPLCFIDGASMAAEIQSVPASKEEGSEQKVQLRLKVLEILNEWRKTE